MSGAKSVLADAKHAQTTDPTNLALRTRGIDMVVDAEDEGTRKWRAMRMEQLRAGAESEETHLLSSRRGAIREIDARSLLSAVERPGWALLLIYEPDVDRCAPLMKRLLGLAGRYPYNGVNPLCLKARATSLGFCVLPSVDLPAIAETSDDSDEDDHDHEAENEPYADPDVLPTLLAYQNGQLVHSWIRVDFTVGSEGEGLQDMLREAGVLGDGAEE